MKKRFLVWLPESLSLEVKRMAEIEGESFSSFLREGLRLVLDKRKQRDYVQKESN